MWQRIQTLYLLLSAGFTTALFFCDKAGEIPYTAYLPYTILLVIISLLHLIEFCSFKFRVFQMRTVTLNAIITLALQVWLVIDYLLTNASYAFNPSAIFPFVAFILDILAIRGIWADEMIVRSSSRLRAAKRNTTKKQ